MFYFILCVLLFGIFIYTMPVAIYIETKRKNERDYILLKIKSLYGLLNYNIEVPYLNFLIKDKHPAVEVQTKVKAKKKNRLIKMDKPFSIERLKAVYHIYAENKPGLVRIMDYICSKMYIKDVGLTIEFGLIDAYYTSIAYGVIWSIVGAFISLLDRQFNIRYSQINISPKFNEETFRLNFNCIITLKIGHIINTGIKSAAYLLVHRKDLKVQIQHLNS